jgi:hypothetical protein
MTTRKRREFTEEYRLGAVGQLEVSGSGRLMCRYVTCVRHRRRKPAGHGLSRRARRRRDKPVGKAAGAVPPVTGTLPRRR